MEIVIEPYNALPCETRVFTINGIPANTYDFGEGRDNRENQDLDNEDDDIAKYGCINHEFVGIPSTPEVLQKYQITQEDYEKIVRELERKLFVGECGWCI